MKFDRETYQKEIATKKKENPVEQNDKGFSHSLVELDGTEPISYTAKYQRSIFHKIRQTSELPPQKLTVLSIRLLPFALQN